MSSNQIWDDLIEKLDKANLVKKDKVDDAELETLLEEYENNYYILQVSEENQLDKELIKTNYQIGDTVIVTNELEKVKLVTQIITILDVLGEGYKFEIVDSFDPPLQLEFLEEYLEGDIDSED